MVKTLKKKPASKATAGIDRLDSQLAAAVKDSAHQIWLAGMGAFAKAQEEGGKVFEALVQEGQALQRKTQAAAEERLGEVAGRMSAMAETMGEKAGRNWDKLEAIFEQRTATALEKLGMPTAADVAALSHRLDALSDALAALNAGAPAARGGKKVARTAKAAKAAQGRQAPAPTKAARAKPAKPRARSAGAV